jgi:hypothetical protein
VTKFRTIDPGDGEAVMVGIEKSRPITGKPGAAISIDFGLSAGY